MCSNRIEIAKNDRRKVCSCLGIICNDPLNHILRPSIRTYAITYGARLGNRQRRWIAINRRRRAENQVFDLILMHGFQQREGAVEVASVIPERLLNGFPYGLITSKVHDRIYLMLLENVFQIRRIPNVHIIGSGALSRDSIYYNWNLFYRLSQKLLK